MTKAELISALEWFRDEAEIHLWIPHPDLEGIGELRCIEQVRYNLMPPRVEVVADNGRGSK